VLLCSDVSDNICCSVSMLRHFGDYVLLCSGVWDAICAIMFRRFGGCLCSYATTFLRLLLCSDVSVLSAVSDVSETAYMLRHFGDDMCCYTSTFRVSYCYTSTFRTCYIPTFWRLSVLLSGFVRYFCVPRSENLL